MISLSVSNFPVDGDDNKYAKKPGSQALNAINFRSLFTTSSAAALLRSPFQLYMTYLLLVFAGYSRLGGSLTAAKTVDQMAFVSTIVEGLGLISLRCKVKQQGSVAGISGSTIGMYCLIYIVRQYLLVPPLKWSSLDSWATEVLQLPSVLMVWDVLKSVLVTHRKSYQEDLDVLSMKYLIPACIVLALLVRPSFKEGFAYSIVWASYFYMDVLALLPQVVMMSRGDGKVLAPIAHFVAATTLSRGFDLWFWFYDFETLIPQLNFYLPGTMNYSAAVIVVVHFLSFVLVADFMYYYLKARFSGSSLSDDCEVGNGSLFEV